MSERDLQNFVFDALHLYGARNVIAYHPFNEGKRAQRSKGFYARLGLVAGVADVALVLPGGKAAFLELKSPKGRSTAEQIAFAQLCADNGCLYWLAKTPEEAAATLFGWGALTENPLVRKAAA